MKRASGKARICSPRLLPGREILPEGANRAHNPTLPPTYFLNDGGLALPSSICVLWLGVCRAAENRSVQNDPWPGPPLPGGSVDPPLAGRTRRGVAVGPEQHAVRAFCGYCMRLGLGMGSASFLVIARVRLQLKLVAAMKRSKKNLNGEEDTPGCAFAYSRQAGSSSSGSVRPFQGRGTDGFCSGFSLPAPIPPFSRIASTCAHPCFSLSLLSGR